VPVSKSNPNFEDSKNGTPPPLHPVRISKPVGPEVSS
jgi:hypothetical protein